MRTDRLSPCPACALLPSPRPDSLTFHLPTSLCSVRSQISSDLTKQPQPLGDLFLVSYTPNSSEMSGPIGLLQGLEPWSSPGTQLPPGDRGLMTSRHHFCHTLSVAPAWAFKCPLPLVVLCPSLVQSVYVYLGLLPSTEHYSFSFGLCFAYALPACWNAQCHLGLYPPESSLVIMGLAQT